MTTAVPSAVPRTILLLASFAVGASAMISCSDEPVSSAQTAPPTTPTPSAPSAPTTASGSPTTLVRTTVATESTASVAPTTTLPPRLNPRLELLAPFETLEYVRYPNGVPWTDGATVFIAARDQSIDVRVSREAYTDPIAAIAIIQADDGSKPRRVALDAQLAPTWEGFDEAISWKLVAADGEVVVTESIPWCPREWIRVDRSSAFAWSPAQDCAGSALTVGARWTIKSGWAGAVGLPYELDVADGTYTAEVNLSDSLAGAFGAPEPSMTFPLIVRSATPSELAELALFLEGSGESAEYWVDAYGRTVVEGDDGTNYVLDAEGNRAEPAGDSTFVGGGVFPPVGSPIGARSEPPSNPATTAATPDDATVIPDLRVWPAHHITTMKAADGRDFLGFSATTWNAGPGALVVEGFRTPGKPAMDAVQIFLDGENQVDTSPAGTIEFHDGGGHDHWHFLDFGRYELTDASRAVVRDSGKQAWCIASTDAVDLADDSAQLSVESMSLTSYCGTGPEEMWVREQLPSGWGDTYSPGQAGQVFDITDLENGTYFIKLTTNPRRVLVEADVSNNVSWRYVVLGGEPGARTVRVPPHQGIETTRHRVRLHLNRVPPDQSSHRRR